MKILITGARSGIGFKTGIKLARLGHDVILTVHKEEQVSSLLEKIKKLDLNNIKCFKLDITKEIDRKKVLEYDIDCLINNAAIGYSGSILDIPISNIRDNFEVNVFSTIRLSQIYAADLFVKKRPGKIIFISSLAGIIPISFLGSYSATKASLISLATVLRREVSLINKDIKVKLIEPGIYNTGYNDFMFENKTKSDSKYFPDLENITLKQKNIFRIIGKDNLNSIVNKIVAAVFDNSNHFLYKAPFSQVFIAKLYMIFFK